MGRVRELLPPLIEALSDAVVVLDRERRIVAANRRYVDTFGITPDQLAGGIPVAAPSPAETRSGPASDRRQLRSFPDAHGAMRRWEGTLDPISGPDGEPALVVEIWRDVSERTKLDTRLAHDDRLASLGMLAAGVAHELNNPLASILAGVESLRRWLTRTPGLPPDAVAEAREVVDLLERETERSRDTTAKLARLAQPHPVAPGWLDLNAAIADTLALLHFQLSRQSVVEVTRLDPKLPPVWVRSSSTRDVLMNVCLNAVQAMPEGGTLTVQTAALGADWVQIVVEDTGHGIAAEHLEQIWDPFFTTRPVGKGAGLGLSVAQRVVQRHGGAIRVTSEPGRGARFTIELPVHGSGGEDV